MASDEVHLIGEGAFGSVCCVRMASGYALIKVVKPNSNSMCQLERELEVYRILGVRSVYGVVWRALPALIMPFWGFDLTRLDNVGLDFGALMFKQITSGLCHLHSLRVLHRDVKPGNILCSNVGKFRLIDFGSSVNIGEAETHRYGTPEFMSRSMAAGFSSGAGDDFKSLFSVLKWIVRGRELRRADIDFLNSVRGLIQSGDSWSEARSFDLVQELIELVGSRACSNSTAAAMVSDTFTKAHEKVEAHSLEHLHNVDKQAYSSMDI